MRTAKCVSLYVLDRAHTQKNYKAPETHRTDRRFFLFYTWHGHPPCKMDFYGVPESDRVGAINKMFVSRVIWARVMKA